MPIRFFLFVLSVLLVSCNSEEAEQDNFNYSGNWVWNDYISDLEQGKLPKEIRDDRLFYVTELVFDASSDDSVTVYNGQAEYANISYRKEKSDIILKLNNDKETRIMFSEKDSTIFFTDSVLNRVFRFSKADKSYIDSTYDEPVAFPAYVNEVTLVGKWLVNDSLLVNFNRFETIEAWSVYDNYSLVINGDLAKHRNGDLLVLSGPDKFHLFGFKKTGNEIFLYDLNTFISEEGEQFYENGRLIYRLRKQ